MLSSVVSSFPFRVQRKSASADFFHAGQCVLRLLDDLQHSTSFQPQQSACDVISRCHGFCAVVWVLVQLC